MEISIVEGNEGYLEDCVEALVDSELARVYYPTRESAEALLKEGIEKQEIYVALNDHFECVGYIWFAPSKMFYKFPYVRQIAVRQESRGQGIGKKLLSFAEEAVFKDSRRLFLTVSDFNSRAKKLYEKIGYRQVGLVEDLFKQGIAEYIMVKSRL
ncbi:MAG TPA: GNAT family N-acetyltransferase [Sedimentisphaerales bacterium]|nr:GNAT family N-acetyltransferase [Sedimentisphaerales bacterium]